MFIALDFDETVTRDPGLWKCFVDLAYIRGHEVGIVTFRMDDGGNPDIEEFISQFTWGVKVYYTAGVPKREFMSRHPEEIQVGVWIDDWPEAVCGCCYK